MLNRLGHWPLSQRRSQDAQSTKTDDSRLGFYAMYKNEATKYDKDFAKRNHEELNSILIVVRYVSFALETCLNYSHRLAYSLPFALHLP